MKRLLFVLVAVVLIPDLALAQPQSRVIIHPTASLADNWYASGYVIGNWLSGNPDDVNLFAGLGRKDKDWSLDILVQRHLGAERHWLLDVRHERSLAGFGLYAEAGVFLDQRGVYGFISLDRPIGRLSLGVETENVHKPGQDSLGFGPRATVAIVKGKLIAAAGYQVRRSEQNTARLYLICPLRIR